ncbi:hypothetical protein [Halorubrum aidingense]|uniref:hypothetical protein n=1 Tax=Halorubrum aidingense TaxID=368623 RepID=UPI00126726ED|nr:hypothetical protein [Halorubrum aidingense]
MISRDHEKVIDHCITGSSLGISLAKRYFLKEEILEIASEAGIDSFEFTSFKSFLNTKSKGWCEQCDEMFTDCDHPSSVRYSKTVYTLDLEAIARATIETAATSGPLSDHTSQSASWGLYRAKSEFGQRTVWFEFFEDQERLELADLDPLNLEFPVLLRDFASSSYEDYRFTWRELLSSDFGGKLSSQVSKIKNKTTAVFAEYDEPFVSEHRTEIKTSIEDYFEKSGYTVSTEIAKHCSEIEKYGISSEPADFICINDKHSQEKILISHGDLRDSGWYVHKFKNGELISIEDDSVFEDLSEQLASKISYRKSISEQLTSTSKYVQILTAVLVVVTSYIMVINVEQVRGLLTEYVSVGPSEPIITGGIFVLQILVAVSLFILLSMPYLKQMVFSWEMYPTGENRPNWDILQHSKIRHGQ